MLNPWRRKKPKPGERPRIKVPFLIRIGVPHPESENRAPWHDMIAEHVFARRGSVHVVSQIIYRNIRTNYAEWMV